MNEAIRQALCDLDHSDAVVFDNPDYDDAIVGYTDEGRVIYDYDAMIKCLVDRDGMTELEAIEFIDYNTIRVLPYAGENAPIIMNRLNLQ